MKNGLHHTLTATPTYLESKLPSILFLVLFILLSFHKLHATTYTSLATGNWSSSATWSPTGVPGSADNVIIKHGTVVTVDSNEIVNNLTIGDATAGVTTVTVASATSLVINGALSINPNSQNSTYTLNAAAGSINIAGTLPTWCSTTGTNSIQASTGTITFAPAITLSATYQNITLTGAATVNFNSNFTDNVNKFIPGTGSTVNFAGNYTVNTTAASWGGKGTAVFAGTNNIIANSNLTLFNVQTAAVPSTSLTLTSAAGTVIIGGAVTIAASTTFNASENFEVDGNFTNNGTFAGGGNTIIFNGTTTVTGVTAFPYIQLGNLTTTITAQVTLNSSATCLGVNYTSYNRGRNLTISNGDTLTVNGNIVLNQPASANTNNLLVNGGTCIVTGNLNFSGVVTTANYISKVTVTTGLLSVAGLVSYDNNTVAANQVITLTSTGVITLGHALSMAYGTLSGTSTGTINFNGAAPSFTFGGTGLPVFSITGNTALNFANGFTNNTNALTTIAAGSTSYFTGSGTITPSAAITFGNVQINSGATATLAGNIIVAGNWVNNGGTLTATGDTIIFTGSGKTIGGTASTIFPVMQMGNATSSNASATINTATSCTGIVFNANATANTLTLAAGLTVNGNVFINQPTAAVTNSLVINGQVCSVTGNLTFSGTNALANCISRVSVSTGSLTIGGTVTYDANTLPADQVITLTSTGSISFTKSLAITYGTLSTTSTGTLNFNGASPSFTFGSSNSPVFTTTNGGTLNFANGFINNTNALTIAATSTSYFTGAGTITGNANINFGNIQFNNNDTLAATGNAVSILGNCILASGSQFNALQNFILAGNFTNSGGLMTGANDTIILTGSGKTIGGTTSTTFPVIQVGNATSTTVSYTMSNANSCAGMIFNGGNAANTFTQNAALTVNGSVIINQPTAAVNNTLAVNAQTCTISGVLSLPGTNTTTGYVAKVSVTTGTLNIAGSINYGSNTTAANAVITASTGSIIFTNPVNITNGTLSLTGAGTIKFNGPATSFIFGGPNAPVFGTAAGSNIYFANGFTNLNSALVLNGTSISYFTGTGIITPTAAITFGTVTLNASSATTLAGNINVANNWVNNGGTITGATDTVVFIGNGKTIGGTVSTAFPALQLGYGAGVAAASVSITKSISCTALIMYGNAYSNTFTVPAVTDTLSVNGDLTINQPGAVVNNTLTDNGIVKISGNLNLPGTNTTSGYVAKVNVGNGTSTLNLAGNLNMGANTRATNAQVVVGSGTINFTNAVDLTSGTLQYTGAGIINFNGASPSFTFDKTNAPVFTTFNGCTINLLHGIVIDTALVLNAGSTTAFNGAGSINPVGNVTFGKVTVNSSDTLLTGATVIIAGNYTLASGALFYAMQNFEADANWANNGGTLAGTTFTVFLNGTAQTISGHATTFQALEVGNSTSAVNAAVTMSCSNSCTAFIFQSGNNSRTFSITTGDTLYVNGAVTMNQPAAAVTNNLAVNAGACVITGALNYVGTSATTTQICRVSVTTGYLLVAGAVNWMANTAVATEYITVTTGILTFGSSLTMGSGSGTLQVNGAGTVNFNGTTAPSFNFGGAATSPSFTTTNGCTLNFYNGFSNNTNGLSLAATSTSVFTGSGTVTPTAAIGFGHVKINAGKTLTLAGAIQVRGNWTDLGTFVPNTYLVTFNGASPTVQTINNANGETFYQLTGSVAGSTVQLNNNVTVTNLLSMTGSYFNLNSNTLTLGNGAGAALSRTASQAYGGTFKRYIPAATAITSTSGSYYGLLPIGTSTYYCPVALNSTANATAGGYISAVFNPSSSVNLVTYTDNEGTAIQVIGLMNSVLSTTGLTGGTYNIGCTFNGFASSGATSDMRLETYTGNAMGSCGTTSAATGTVANPTVLRTGLTAAQLSNTWVAGSRNVATTPLQYFYYSRTNGNWSGTSTWSYTAGGAGASCSCTPPSNAYVTISAGQTVTVDVNESADYIDVSTGATLTDVNTATLTGNKTVTVNGTGQLINSGIWNFSGPVNFSTGTTYTGSGTVTINGNVTMPTGSTYKQTAGALNLAADAALNGVITLGNGNLNLTGAGNNISGTGSLLSTGSGVVTITNGKNIAGGSSLTFGTAAAPLSVALSGAQNVINNGTVIINGNLTGTVAGSLFTNAASATLSVTGSLLTTGSLSAETSPNTVTYNGSGNQTINATTAGYVNLIVANSGVKSLGANVGLATSLAIQDSAILDETTYALTGAASLNMSNKSELRLTRSSSSTYPELSGAYSLTGGTVTINQTSGTATLAGTPYYNLKLTGTSSYDISAVSTINNNLLVSNSAAFINNANLKITDSLVYASSGTSTLNNNISAGSFTQSAGTFNDGGFNMMIKGAAGFNNNGGTFNTTGIVTLGGTVAQAIGGSTGTAFANLTIKNAAGVTLNQPVSVNSTLNLTSGILYTNALAAITMLPGTNYTGGSTASFVSGPMYKTGSDDFIFPIGKGGIFAQAGISGLTDSTTQVVGEYFNQGYSNTTSLDPKLTQVSKAEYWTIERTVTTDSMQIQLFWTNATQAGIINCANLAVAHFTGGLWIDEGGTVAGGSACSGTGSGSIQTDNFVGTFSPFTFGGSGGLALPIELVSFNAVPAKTVVLTKWVTELEINNAYFTVERSGNGTDFEAIGDIKGAGNSTATLNYEFTDEAPLKGVAYYRLRQTDYNGNTTLSNVVPVDMGTPGTLTMYPNPATDHVNLNITNPSSEVVVNIYDITGRQMFGKTYNVDENASNQVITLPTSGNLPSGLYLVSVATNQSQYTQKLIIR